MLATFGSWMSLTVKVITVITDRKSMVHLQTQPKLSERQVRWNEFLAEFGNELTIEYQSGKTNVVADALSRRADHIRAYINEKQEKAQTRQKQYSDAHRREEEFKVGDLILLSTADFTYTQGQKKLLDKRIGPFEVLEKVGKVAYRIKLPHKLCLLHSVFHVSKLTRYHATDLFSSRPPQLIRPPPDSEIKIDGQDAWEVEEIIDKSKLSTW